MFELFLAKEIDVKTALKMLKLTPDLVKALMDQVNIPIRQLKQSSNLQRNLILCQCQVNTSKIAVNQEWVDIGNHCHKYYHNNGKNCVFLSFHICC